jgi:hypothetical protein
MYALQYIFDGRIENKIIFQDNVKLNNFLITSKSVRIIVSQNKWDLFNNNLVMHISESCKSRHRGRYQFT